MTITSGRRARPGPGLGGAPLRIRTADGVELAGRHLPGPASGPVVVIAHGFTNAVAKTSTSRIARRLHRSTGVLPFDFRGHGGSGGASTVGRDEQFDLDAAVSTARGLGYASVAVVGFSMGAAVAIRQAAIGIDLADAVVSVSAPSRWYLRSTTPMRRIHWLLEHPMGPTVGRWLGVRLGDAWEQVPPTPLELIGRVRMPLLIVHGTADPYFGPVEAEMLAAASHGHAELWLERGMGHAESGSTPALIDRISAWIANAPR